METLESRKLRKVGDYLDSEQRHNYVTIVDRYFEDVQYQMLMHEQGHTQSDMEAFDRIAHARRIYVAIPEKGLTTETNAKSYDPHHGGGSDIVKTEEQHEYKQIVRWTGKAWPR